MGRIVQDWGRRFELSAPTIHTFLSGFDYHQIPYCWLNQQRVFQCLIGLILCPLFNLLGQSQSTPSLRLPQVPCNLVFPKRYPSQVVVCPEVRSMRGLHGAVHSKWVHRSFLLIWNVWVHREIRIAFGQTRFKVWPYGILD